MLLSFWNYNSIQFEGVYHNYQTESKTFGEKILVQCIDLKHTTVQSILFIHESLVWIHTSSIYDHLVTVQCYDRHTHQGYLWPSFEIRVTAVPLLSFAHTTNCRDAAVLPLSYLPLPFLLPHWVFTSLGPASPFGSLRDLGC